MTGVALSLVSAFLFGTMSVSLAFAVRRNRDVEAGALVTAATGVLVCGASAVAVWDWAANPWPFLLAGLLAPGGSQILFVRGVRDVGAARASVVVGAAPLVSVTIALVFFGEPVHAALVVGAVLIVAGGLTLAGERVRPATFRAVGILFAFSAAAFFATRDNVVRRLAVDADVAPMLAATTTILSGTLLIAGYLLLVRGRALGADLRRATVPYALPGLAWGLSYVFLFEAFYRARVTVVSPLVATESLFGVLLAVLLLRRTELVGRHLLVGASLIVAGGALIGAFR